MKPKTQENFNQKRQQIILNTTENLPRKKAYQTQKFLFITQ